MTIIIHSRVTWRERSPTGTLWLEICVIVAWVRGAHWSNVLAEHDIGSRLNQTDVVLRRSRVVVLVDFDWGDVQSLTHRVGSVTGPVTNNDRYESWISERQWIRHQNIRGAVRRIALDINFFKNLNKSIHYWLFEVYSELIGHILCASSFIHVILFYCIYWVSCLSSDVVRSTIVRNIHVLVSINSKSYLVNK